MKKQILILVIAGLIIATFSSCKDEPALNTMIRAENVIELIDGSLKNIATIKAGHFDHIAGEWTSLIAQAPFRNNGFVLRLPNTVPEGFLMPTAFGVGLYEVRSFVAYDRNGRRVGTFFNRVVKDGVSYSKIWIYAEEDINIYKQGWNLVFSISQGGSSLPPEWTTDKSRIPENLTFNWYFWSFD